MPYPQAIINIIVDDPNNKSFTNQQVIDIINSGALDEQQLDLLKSRLKEPRLSTITQILGAKMALKSLESDYKAISLPGATLSDMREFVRKYENISSAASYVEHVKSLISEKTKATEVSDYQMCQTILQYEQFVLNHPSSSLVSEAKLRIETLKKQYAVEDDRVWSAIDDSEDRLNAYTSNGNYVQHRDEVESKREEIQKKKEEDETIKKNWEKYRSEVDSVLSDPNSDVDNYVWLIRKYPVMKEYIKNWMLEDMQINPGRYQRNEMAAIIFGGKLVLRDSGNFEEQMVEPIFSMKEIIDAGIMDRKRLEYVQTHPTIQHDVDPNMKIPKEDNFKMSPNSTDVYFFGVPGCGKTSVLAGLLNTPKVAADLSFRVLMRGSHKGFNYASILETFIKRSVFPMSTPKVVQRMGDNAALSEEEGKDDKFIQIIDTELHEHCKNVIRNHRVSIVEMPGERTVAMAAATDVKSVKLLGNGASELLQNGNNKVIFFVIDQADTKLNPTEINGAPVSLTQGDVINSVAELLLDMLKKETLKNLKAVHIILAKSDMLPDTSMETMKSILSGTSPSCPSEYARFVDTVKEMCNSQYGDVNKHCGRVPHVFTFSLGEPTVGDFVKYDPADSIKLLKVICANTVSVAAPTYWDSVVDWMNK